MTYDIKTRFFDQVNLAYYLTDDFKAYVGHRYLGGKNALALGGEYGMPLGHGVMASLFAEGRIGEDDYHGVWAGVRFYFGQNDKTLIRRHREDDPTDWGVGIDGTGNTGTRPALLSGFHNSNLILRPGIQLAELVVAKTKYGVALLRPGPV